MKYEYRLIAFLDILGFSNKVYSATHKEQEQIQLYEMIKELREFFLVGNHQRLSILNDDENIYNLDRSVSQASDSLVFSCKLSEYGGVMRTISECSFAYSLIISHGFLVRGVITYGQLIHKDDILLGPAFIEAYKAESKESLPIIKFNKQILEIAKEFPNPAQIDYEEVEESYIKEYCSQLNPDTYFIDYFNNYNDLVGVPYDHNESKGHYEKLRSIVSDGLLKAKTWSILKKMEWAKRNFNDSKAVRLGVILPINVEINRGRKLYLYLRHLGFRK